MRIVRIVIFDEFFLRIVHAECIVVNCDSTRHSAPYCKEWPAVYHFVFRQAIRGVEWKVSMSVMNALRIRKVDL